MLSFPGHSLFFCMSPVRHFSHSKLFSYGSNKCFTAHVLGLSYLLTSTNQEEFVLQLALLFFLLLFWFTSLWWLLHRHFTRTGAKAISLLLFKSVLYHDNSSHYTKFDELILFPSLFVVRQRVHLYVFVPRKKGKSHVSPQNIKLLKSTFVTSKMRLGSCVAAFQQEQAKNCCNFVTANFSLQIKWRATYIDNSCFKKKFHVFKKN